jgi:hypothetical protein
MEYSGSLQARGRTVSLLLDGQLIYRWMPEQTENGAFAFTVPLPLDDAGYYTVSMLIDPPCPATFQPNLLRCRSGELTDVSLMSVADSPLDNPIQLDAGIALTGAYLPPEALTENVLPVRLWWNFTQPVDADTVRFVKVLDQEGNEAAGIDTASGPQQSGDSLAETLELDLSGLTSGTYEVYTGWYTYPDLTRIPVLSDVPGAPDNWILLGTVTIASDV